MTDQSRQLARPGFDGSAADVGSLAVHAGTTAAVAREEAELKAAIVLARQNPRDEMTVFTKILGSCRRQSFAEDATYSFPRGNGTVDGPSVRLAREMARCWGNCRSGSRVVSIDREYVHIKGYFHDIEANSYKESEAKFRKLVQRKNKAGETMWVEPDERDLRELINKNGAICERNAILQSMPPDFIEDALTEAAKTMSDVAKREHQASPEESRKKMVIAFGDLGVTPSMITAYLGHSIDLITSDEIVSLKKVYTSIRDGNSRREDYFEVGEQKPAATTGKSRADELAAKFGSNVTTGDKITTPAPAASEPVKPEPTVVLDQQPKPAAAIVDDGAFVGEKKPAAKTTPAIFGKGGRSSKS